MPAFKQPAQLSQPRKHRQTQAANKYDREKRESKVVNERLDLKHSLPGLRQLDRNILCRRNAGLAFHFRDPRSNKSMARVNQEHEQHIQGKGNKVSHF